jgi:hypothetical protein
MSRYAKWFSESSRTDRRRNRRSPAFRPTVGQLEDRQLMSVTFHGGPLMSNVHVKPIHSGSTWSDTQQLNVSGRTARPLNQDHASPAATGSLIYIDNRLVALSRTANYFELVKGGGGDASSNRLTVQFSSWDQGGPNYKVGITLYDVTAGYYAGSAVHTAGNSSERDFYAVFRAQPGHLYIASLYINPQQSQKGSVDQRFFMLANDVVPFGSRIN